ncbi:3-carboxy-cis,cis-muconate cycloisomerase [Sinirhodobacter huangdaonensis]|uniref:3-carboxy-cis,cis-muconate cycloisomerase n=1 Tax=Paenirhodobacter huangdaonensis TaxID=2501515 RepID=A0A3S3LWH0_9RHOB|nr:3-carboxy-cis,cis-muconate cycloisomerase [Sinirhodobacter huangdaonensis]RWR54555.1 3-carboxy-cis,cis-muconate cycloisomerase [Sinirhodobacter huangdaonensis]
MSVFEHPWLGGLFADPEMVAIWGPERHLAQMLAFERAWSVALGACGLAPPEAAAGAGAVLAAARIAPEALRSGMGTDGVPTVALVALLRAGQPGPVARAIHHGATSQDVLDTALALTLRDCSGLLERRLVALGEALAGLEARFGAAPLMGRTRMQAATRITVRDRLLSWRLPLEGHRARLAALRPVVERVQVGGAAGDRAALGAQAQAMTDRVARELGLGSTGKAWHAMREGVVEYGSFLSLVSGSLGKIGQDVALMAQQGLDEIALSGGGGSSAMPHKQNPVLAELLVTLARFNATQVSGLHQALVHEQERSGAAWSLEWMILPQMALATGRALAAAQTLLGQVVRIGSPD